MQPPENETGGWKMKAWLKRGFGFIRRYLSSETVDFSMVVALFVPLLVDQIFISLTSILNSSMISGSGAAAVSAVSTVDIVNQFFSTFLQPWE